MSFANENKTCTFLPGYRGRCNILALITGAFLPAGGGTLAGVAGTATKLLAATNPFTLAFGVFGLSAALKRLRADGLVTADKDGKFSAIAPEDARAHLDRLWDRLLDVDSLDRQATSAGA